MTIVDDLPVGQSCRSTGRTISEGEFMLLHNLMGAMTPLHANKHYMQKTEYGERILGGGVVIGLVAAGWANSALNHSLIADFGVRWRAALGIDAKFVGPVQPGDTLYFVYTLNAAPARWPSSRGVDPQVGAPVECLYCLDSIIIS